MMLQLLICLASVVVMGFLLLAVGLVAGWAFRLLDRRDPPGKWPLMLLVLLARSAWAVPATCNAAAYENYTDELLALPFYQPGMLLKAQATGAPPPVYFDTGDQITIRVDWGCGTVTNGTHVSINRSRFEQNCLTGGINCEPFEQITTYLGDASIRTTCSDELGNHIKWTTNVPLGAPLPNEVVFTPSSPLAIPANTFSSFCVLAFDVKVIALPSQSAPTNPVNITQNFGFRSEMRDAVCDNKPVPVSNGWADNLTLQLCPRCKPGFACDQQTGLCAEVTAPTPFVPHVVVNVGPTPTPGGPTCQWYPTADGAEMRCGDGRGWSVGP